MPMILGANGNQGPYEIDGSYMIDSAAAAGLSRFGNNSRNGNTFTISFWVKRTKLGRNELVNSKVEDSGANSLVIQFDSNDKLSVIGQPASGTGAGGNREAAITTAVFRDTAAWYHVVYRQDTTQGTASNRHRIYVNGVQQSLATNNALDQNVAFAYFYNASSYPYAIGNDERDNEYGNWYMAEHHYTDGVSNGPDAFAETNDNGVWVPKFYQGSHGTYGHYLKFKQSGAGSGTTAVGGHDYTTGSASTIGADSSGNDNHFHAQGYSATKNRTIDSPSNNFCTLNFNHKSTANVLISEGALKVVLNQTAGWQHAAGTMAVKNGKFYWEAKALNVAATDKTSIGVLQFNTTDVDFIGNTNTDRSAKGISGHGAGTGSYSYAEGDIIQCAMDLDNNKIYWGKNGTYFGDMNPAAGSGSTTQTVNNSRFSVPVVGGYGDSSWEMNFGVPQFSISSGNADADGHGNFEYAVPSGYFALCTKNLAEYG